MLAVGPLPNSMHYGHCLFKRWKFIQSYRMSHKNRIVFILFISWKIWRLPKPFLCFQNMWSISLILSIKTFLWVIHVELMDYSITLFFFMKSSLSDRFIMEILSKHNQCLDFIANFSDIADSFKVVYTIQIQHLNIQCVGSLNVIHM